MDHVLSNAISAHGMIVRHNGVEVPELRDVTLPTLSRRALEKTLTTQVDDVYQMGRGHFGALQFEIGFLSSDHAALVTAWATGSIDEWLIIFPDGAAWAFSGAIEAIGPKAPVDGGLTASVSVQPCGPIALLGGYTLTENDGFLLLESSGRIEL